MGGILLPLMWFFAFSSIRFSLGKRKLVDGIPFIAYGVLGHSRPLGSLCLAYLRGTHKAKVIKIFLKKVQKVRLFTR